MPRTGESVWLPDDALAVVALVEYEDGLHSCGHPREEAFAKGRTFAYDVKAYRCHACAAISREEAKRRTASDMDMAGLHFVAVDNGNVLDEQGLPVE